MTIKFIKDIIMQIMEESSSSSLFETKLGIREPPPLNKLKGMAISPPKSSLKRKLETREAE